MSHCTDQSLDLGVDHSYDGGPKAGSTRRTDQCIANHVSQGSRGVVGVEAKGEEASDLGDSNSKDGPKKVVSKPHSSYQ